MSRTCLRVVAVEKVVLVPPQPLVLAVAAWAFLQQLLPVVAAWALPRRQQQPLVGPVAVVHPLQQLDRVVAASLAWCVQAGVRNFFPAWP